MQPYSDKDYYCRELSFHNGRFSIEVITPSAAVLFKTPSYRCRAQAPPPSVIAVYEKHTGII
jgi:hypothetical protein